MMYFWTNYKILILGETSILGSLLIYPDGKNVLQTYSSWRYFIFPRSYFRRTSRFYSWTCTIPSLYVNDIHDTVIASSASCFADDTKLFKTINNQTDANLLQNDLDNLSTWSTSSGLNFSELKTNCQTVTRKRSPSL